MCGSSASDGYGSGGSVCAIGRSSLRSYNRRIVLPMRIRPQPPFDSAPVACGRLALIRRVAPRENRIEDEAEQRQPNAEPCALAEVLSDGNRHDEPHDDVHEGNEEQEDPPPRLSRDTEQHDPVVNRNEHGPARLSSLREYGPE